MGPFVLDTDHITLLQRGDRNVVERFGDIPEEAVATSIVTYEEQLRGRLTVVRRANTPERLEVAYRRLREMLEFFCAIRILDFDQKAAEIYGTLRRQHGSVGTMDLRIAATVQSVEGIIVTRNTQDFELIGGLPMEDWSLP
ncbi:MAG TPA: type II toxin-antitoxin system VapC family toxin [Vicinamibacteria bacterium]|nr:type II toxin-antitoxin system VapC family toxin [Vicinamibacteria bacterium]